MKYKIQDRDFVTDSEILDFTGSFDSILVHFDIDVLDERTFHSTYFANPELSGDGSGGGRMTIDRLSGILSLISSTGKITGLTIAVFRQRKWI